MLVEIMVNMGYNKREIEESLSQNKYDDMTATYLLLSRRTTEVYNKGTRVTQLTILLLS